MTIAKMVDDELRNAYKGQTKWENVETILFPSFSLFVTH